MVESCTSHVQNDFHIYVKCIYGAVHMFKVGNLCRTHGRIVHLVLHRRSDEFVISIRNRKCLPLRFSMCYTEKASPTRHRPERQDNARANRRKQCSPNETKPYSKPTHRFSMCGDKRVKGETTAVKTLVRGCCCAYSAFSV